VAGAQAATTTIRGRPRRIRWRGIRKAAHLRRRDPGSAGLCSTAADAREAGGSAAGRRRGAGGGGAAVQGRAAEGSRRGHLPLNGGAARGARVCTPGGWPAATCPPWTPPANGLLRALDGPHAGRRLGDGLGRTGLAVGPNWAAS
jgi:hypothetical protein